MSDGSGGGNGSGFYRFDFKAGKPTWVVPKDWTQPVTDPPLSFDFNSLAKALGEHEEEERKKKEAEDESRRRKPHDEFSPDDWRRAIRNMYRKPWHKEGK